ncbi:hypothetical protein ASF37_12510, partial [Aeromicrobium sp. Leaf289]|uniref:class I SAM-dependent methyltransferase n=1 Tax=Aeromicrobium sp. Leaf289 TaxID=1736324 RepID=UPI0006FDC8F5
MLDRSDLPTTILELGCGDGRDAFTFAQSGRNVTGLDRSHIGVDHAGRKAERAGIADRLRFRTCDVSDTAALATEITSAREDDKPLLTYMRFFLHSITAEVQAGLLNTVAEHARPGDHLAVEFRTDKDEANAKVHGGHYRRYQSAAAFRDQITALGYTVIDETEGTGLSPYGDEDPELYRAIAI